MDSSLGQITTQFAGVMDAAAQFNKRELFAMLSGSTAFVSAALGADPLAAVSAAIEVAGTFATICNTGTLQGNLDKLKKWLTFGMAYAPLENSINLDFNTFDVESVPEIMKVIFMNLAQMQLHSVFSLTRSS